MNSPIYVYDSRTQYQEPVFVVYDERNVEPVIMALYGLYPDFLHVSKQRLHQYNGTESYVGKSKSSRRR